MIYSVPVHIVFSIGYVEFRSIDLVEKALALSGTIVMGLPIMVQLTESERNKTHAGDGYVRPFLLLLTNVLTFSPQEPPPSARSYGVPWRNVRVFDPSLSFLTLICPSAYMLDPSISI